MIFTTTPIRDENVTVRFYYYADPHKGYGDAGTVRFVRIALTQFECEPDSDFNGNPYYRYIIHKAVLDELFPSRYGIGYEQSDEQRQLEESHAAQLHYQQLATIQEL